MSPSDKPSRGPRRRWRLLLGLTLGVLLSLVLALPLVAYLVLESPSGRAQVVRLIEGSLQDETGLSLTLGRIEGSLFSSFTLSSLTLSDKSGAWLEAQDLRLAWSPFSLITDRRLLIESFSIARLDLARTPDLPPDDSESGPLEVPRLPLSVNIGALQLPRIALAAPLLGEAFVFSLSGHFRAPEGGDFGAALDLTRLDGAEGRLQIKARLDPDGEELTLALNLTDAAGGLIAQLIEDPSLPRLTAALDGTGTLTQWRGELEAKAEGMASLRSAVELQLAGRPTLAAKGTAEVAALLDEALRPLVLPQLAYDFEAVYDEGNDLVKLPRLEVQSDSFAVSGHADFALDDNALNGSLQARLRDPAAINDLLAPAALAGGDAVADIAFAPDSLAVALKGRLSGVALPENIAAAGADIDLRLTGDPAAEAFVAALDGKVALEGFSSGVAEADGLLGSAPDLALTGRYDVAASHLAVDHAALTAEALSGEVTGGIAFESLAGSFGGSLRLPDLAPFGALGDLALSGGGNLGFEAESGNFAEGLALTLNGDIARLETPFAEANALLGQKVTLHAALAQAADGLTVSALRLQGARADIQASGRLAKDYRQIAADYDVTLPDLAPLSDSIGTPLAGRLETSGRIEGDLTSPNLSGTAALRDAAAEGVTVERLDLDYRLTDLAAAPAGTLAVTGQSSYGPLAANGSFKLAEDRLIFDPLTLEARQAEVKAEGPLEILLASGLLQGRLRGRAADLAQFSDLVGGTLGGKLSFTASLAARDGRQVAEAKASGQGLAFDDLRVASADLGLQSADLLGGFSGAATLAAKGVAYDDQQLDALNAEVAGNLAALDFDVQAKGNYFSPFDITAVGKLDAAGEETKVTVAKLSGTAVGRPLSLRNSLTLLQGPARTAVTGLALQLGPGRIEGAFEQTAERVRLDLDFNDIPLDLAQTFDPDLAFEGSLSGTARLNGPPNAPKGRVDVAVKDFETAHADDTPLPKLAAEAQLTIGGGRLGLTGQVSGFADRPLTLQAAIPANLALSPFVFDATENAPLTGSLQFAGSAESLAQLFLDPQQLLRGSVAIDLALRGTPANPQLSGEVSLTEGTYENLLVGTTLKGLEIKVVADGKDLTIETLKARTNGSGRIDGGGRFTIDPARNFPLEMTADLKKARLIERDDATIAFDGRIALTGTLQKLDLKGQLETTTAELRLISNLPPSVVTIDVVEKNRPAEDRRRTNGESAAPVLITLDVSLKMPDRVFLRGQDISTEWQGEFYVTGTSDEPVIRGTLRPVRGYVGVLGKRFELQQGSITLDGADDIDPILDLEAIYRKTDLTAIVQVKGRLTAPDIILTSSPPLPQDEVIARVLFDKSASALTAAEAVELAAAVASLASGGSSGLLSDIRAGLGLDVLSVGAGEAGGAGLSAGKYLVDGVYVGVDQGTSTASTRAKVEVELTPNIKLESTANSESSSVGVKWKWDY